MNGDNNIIPFKKKRLETGVILSGLGGVINENGIVAKELSDTDLLYYGLYWDKIIITQIPMFQFSTDIIEQFRSNGFLEFFSNAPKTIHSSQMQHLALESLLACQSVRKQDKNTDWIIHNNVANGFNLLESETLLEQHSIRIEIAKCLPYPSKYVPIETLRRFRDKYLDELDELNYAQYKLFQTISDYDNGDKRELARQYEIAAFDKAVKQYEAAFASNFQHYSLKSIVAHIKSNHPSLLEIGAAVGDMVMSGGSLSGIHTVGKTIFSLYGSKQKIHEAKLNSPQFHFISSAIESGIVLQRSSTE